MAWIVASIHRIMLVSGVLTLTMVYGVIAPDAALRSTFGEGIDGVAADVVVRNWAVLIGLMGAMLIYGANRPHVRPFVLTVTGTSKRLSSCWCCRMVDASSTIRLGSLYSSIRSGSRCSPRISSPAQRTPSGGSRERFETRDAARH
jgi:hypothetical protein